MDRAIIAEYRAGADRIGKAIEGLTSAELNAHPIPGTWSIQQIVFHLMDSDLIAADRMKRIIAEDNPTLIGYDETRFAQRLFHDQLDPQLAAEVFRLNRLLTAEILLRLPDDTFRRTGEHNEAGTVSLEQLVRGYVKHLAHHLKFIHEKRDRLGKPLADTNP
jgi:uncharacterized damage-inducible protein DinB